MQPHLDANESIFFARELETILATVFETKYPELKATRFFPVTTEAGPIAEVVTYRMFDEVGMAKLIHSYSDDFPRVDVKGKEVSSPIKPYGDSYGYNFQEVRAARRLGRPLDSMRAIAARRAQDRIVEAVALFGDAEAGLPGFLTNPNIPRSVAQAGAGTDTRWAPVAGVTTKTPDEIIRDVNSILNGIKVLTKGREAANMLIMPTTQYAHIATTPRSALSDTTILTFLKAAHPDVTFESWELLANLPAALVIGSGNSTNVMIAYRRDPLNFQLHIAQPFEQLPPFDKGSDVEIKCHQRLGGLVTPYPLSAARVEGI
jgi:hypothetical protein